MSSDEEQRIENEYETKEYPCDNEDMSNVEESHNSNDISQLDSALDNLDDNTNLDPVLTK